MRWVLFSVVVSILAFSCEEKKRVAYFSNGKQIPEPIGWVSDYEDIFTSEEEQELYTILEKYGDETGYEIAVVTLDTSMVGILNDDMFTTTLELANFWSIGKAEMDNGVLISLSKARKKIIIQNGVGTEKIMSDLQTKKFIDSVFIPFYKEGLYYKGTLEGTKAIMAFLRDKKIPTK